MTVHLYTTCWNEEKMLGFFFRHYDSWVDRYIIYDDGSTDGTIEILKAHPKVEIRTWNRLYPNSFVISEHALLNEIWKESRGQADWVVVVAIDEHLFVPGTPMKDYLERCNAQGVTLAPALGYQMFSEEFPEADEHLCHTRTQGAPALIMNKLSIFNPDALEETNFSKGRHIAKSFGRIKLPKRDELLLLHYKNISFESALKRRAALFYRRRERNGKISKNTWTRERLRETWNRFAKNAVDISNPDLSPWRSHKEKRWWRPAWKFYAKSWIYPHRMKLKRKLGFGKTKIK